MTEPQITTASILVACTFFVLLHLGVFIPGPISMTLLYIPGRLSDFTSQHILDDPGTHGFGYFNPALLIPFFYLTAFAASIGAELLTRRLMRNRS